MFWKVASLENSLETDSLESCGWEKDVAPLSKPANVKALPGFL
jgi:hypothetical protein